MCAFLKQTQVIIFLCSASTLASGKPALGHSFDSMNLPAEGLHVHFALSGSYRTKGLVKKKEVWTVPGTLMGGDAQPFRAGLALDEAFVTPIYRNGNTYAMLKIGKHSGAEELEIDHAFVGYQIFPFLAFEAGKMAGIFTTFNAEHATELSFSSNRFVHDVFWGGQLNDEGARVKTNFLGFDLGAEAWRGNSFPANNKESNRPAYDVYARYTLNVDALTFQTGAFVFDGVAQSRTDNRSNGSHSHSNVTKNIEPIYFEGTENVYGAMGKFVFSSPHSILAGAQGEVSVAHSKGVVQDATRLASFDSSKIGYWGEAFFGLKSDLFSARAERIKVTNRIGGTAAGALAEKLVLRAKQKDPYRYALGYQHTFDSNFKIRAEWIQDFTTLEKQSIVALSAAWSGMVMHWNL
jgi:hypothetical protein